LSGSQRAAVRHTRLWLGTIVGIVIFICTPAYWSLLARWLVAWNGGALLFLVLVYIWMIGLDAKRIHARYEEGDPSAPVILLIVTVGALASLAAIVAMLATVKDVHAARRFVHVALAAATIVDSWLLVATMFTIHYANMFYRSIDDPPLRFPETPRPVFLDFIYFSFTIAVACQTADVVTTRTSIRRVVTAQALVSFVFNLAILGFAVNVSAGLVGS